MATLAKTPKQLWKPKTKKKTSAKRKPKIHLATNDTVTLPFPNAVSFCCTGSASLPNEAKETINHPSHYGGEHNPYEAIKVIEAWDLNFNLGNTLKYISRSGKKGKELEDLKKAAWYLNREIENLQK